MKKREGAYYVWTEKEIDEVLGNKSINGIEGLTYAEVFKTYYDIKSSGNVPQHEVSFQFLFVFYAFNWFHYNITVIHSIHMAYYILK